MLSAMLAVFVKIMAVSAVNADASFYERLHNGFPKSPSIAYYQHAMKETEAYEAFQTSSFCKCKGICMVKNCTTVSMEMTGSNSFSCNISTKMVGHMKLRRLENAVTFGQYPATCTAIDGMIYNYEYVPNIPKDSNLQSGTFDEAVEGCRQWYPANGRLALLKTNIQFESFWQCMIGEGTINEGTGCTLNLRYMDGQVVWGDGTNYVDSEISGSQGIEVNPNKPHYIVVIRDGKLTIEAVREPHGFCCQLNPMDIEV